MAPNRFEGAHEFIIELIRAGAWDLRFNAKREPSAALPKGFGNGEKDVRLHFLPNGGRVQVIGFIRYHKEIGIKRPYVFVSIYRDIEDALQAINTDLMPNYREVWYNAQPLIENYLKDHPEDGKDL